MNWKEKSPFVLLVQDRSIGGSMVPDMLIFLESKHKRELIQSVIRGRK